MKSFEIFYHSSRFCW